GWPLFYPLPAHSTIFGPAFACIRASHYLVCYQLTQGFFLLVILSKYLQAVISSAAFCACQAAGHTSKRALIGSFARK
ncbi:MAG: hypothetical protein QF420_00700, partial [Alphaproteobacteria bacterium]|nr:hypothetical protein [Alphaproteobacteria bacterium]